MYNQERKINKNLVLSSLLFFVCLMLILPGTALSISPWLSIFPPKFELEVKRDQQLEKSISILNRGDAAIPIEVRVLNFTAEDHTGTIQFYSQSQEVVEKGTDDASFNPSKWITIQNPNFILEPGERENVRFLIEIPKDTEPGGHYAVILFEPKLPSFYFEENTIMIIPEIGALLLFSVEVEGLTRVEEPLTIVEFAIPENLHLKKLENLAASFTGIFSEVLAAEKTLFSIVETSYLPFTLQIKNNDIYHLKPEGSLIILANNGKIVGETVIKRTTILPGKTRKIPVEFKPNLPEKLERYLPASISDFISENLFFGKYKARLILTTENSKIEEDIEFWVFPWKIWLSAVFTICLIMFLIIKYRKRIKLAILIIFRGVRPPKN